MIIPVEDADRAEALLREDVEWAVRNNRWAPSDGAYVTQFRGETTWAGKCACAIGTMCIRRNLPISDKNEYQHNDVLSAARFCGVPREWMFVVYIAVCGRDPDDFSYDEFSWQAFDVAMRLVALVETLKEST